MSWKSFWNEAWEQIKVGPQFGKDNALNPTSVLDDLNIPYDKDNVISLADPANITGKAGQFTNSFSDILGEIPNAIKDYLGVTQRQHLNRADALAEQSQAFNEQYSMQQMQEQARMFDLNYSQAQQNIDFQKDIAQKNLALQTDAFNAQLRENELTRQREDSAYQRQVADLKAAGFSPLMASNGANAASMSVGSAPQYDGSAVSTAQGSAIDLAKEYAALKNMAAGQYLSRKQAATNERIGAMLALSDLAQQRKLGFQNLALQSFNLANSIKDSKKRREQIDEQIESSKAQRNWMAQHGYRNQDTWSVLLPVMNKLADKFNINFDSVADKIASGYKDLSQTIKSIFQPDSKYKKEDLPKTTQELTSKLTDDELEQVALLASLGDFGMSFSDKDINLIADYYYEKLPDNRKFGGKDSFVKWMKRDGVANVLYQAFGLNYIK